MKYDRVTLLGLKLRSHILLRKLTRAELFSRMQVIRKVDPWTRDAYRERQKDELIDQRNDSPHGHPWHVSFHASQFPGDDPMACPRQALYRMMDFPAAEPLSRKARVAGVVGKAIEHDIVHAYLCKGILLSNSPDDPIQTGFQFPEAWLTGSVDSVILPPNWNKPLPIEIKSAYADNIKLMQCGALGPVEAHVKQLKTQIAMVRHAQENGTMWSSFDPCDHGFLYYFSRDNADDTAEFRVDYDKQFFELGIERLKQWKAMFEEDFLPSVNPSKRHPMGWRWSYPPCQFCNFKKTCQLDHQQNITQLSESVGVERAKLIRPQYDLESARLRVLARWQPKQDVKISPEP